MPCHLPLGIQGICPEQLMVCPALRGQRFTEALCRQFPDGPVHLRDRRLKVSGDLLLFQIAAQLQRKSSRTQTLLNIGLEVALRLNE